LLCHHQSRERIGIRAESRRLEQFVHRPMNTQIQGLSQLAGFRNPHGLNGDASVPEVPALSADEVGMHFRRLIALRYGKTDK
jgi:hypothetical protein